MKREKTRPNFFIVGAPKCGTTSMYTYLGSHPEIFFPQVKEPHHFGSDIHSPLYVRDREAYLDLFAESSGEPVVGEASVWYLYSEKAAMEIREFSPDAKILIMLRNPVEMVYSYHSQRLAWGNEEIRDFSEALDAEPDRRNGLRLPRKNPYPVAGLYYSEIARYSQQVERYLDAFGGRQVHIVLFDDFRSDTAGVYREVLQFLGVDPDYQPEFVVENPNRSRRSMFLHNLLYHAPPGLIAAGKLVVPPPLRKGLWNFLARANTSYRCRPQMSGEVRARLVANYREDILRLGEMIGRDLETKWLSSEPSSRDVRKEEG